MYRAFDIIGLSPQSVPEGYEARGRDRQHAHQEAVRLMLDAFLQEDGSLDGAELTRNWFPPIEAHVFLSHSHADEQLALRLAGWLWETFRVETFVDSCVWRNCDTLLKAIDDRFCLNEGRKTYNYEKRNRSTSHVHMMLSAALAKMIDRTECAWFLNTARSVTGQDQFTPKTSSPWLYAEIATMNLVRRRDRTEHRMMAKLAKSLLDEQLERKFSVQHKLELHDFTKLDLARLSEWARAGSPAADATRALDILYDEIAP